MLPCYTVGFFDLQSGCATISLYLSAAEFAGTKGASSFCIIHLLCGLLKIWAPWKKLHHNTVTNIGTG